MKYVIRLCTLTAFFVFITAQMAAGYAGIENSIGHIWALVAIFAALFVRFTLPITIGAFFGAMSLWGWHWPLALLFTVPGLVLAVPGAMAAVFSLSTHGAANLTPPTPICAEHQ